MCVNFFQVGCSEQSNKTHNRIFPYHAKKNISILWNWTKLWKLDFPTFFSNISKIFPYYGRGPIFQCTAEHVMSIDGVLFDQYVSTITTIYFHVSYVFHLMIYSPDPTLIKTANKHCPHPCWVSHSSQDTSTTQ